MTDLYKIIGVARDATPEQIKRAFRKLSKKLHPDVGGNAEAFHEAEKAYRILSDPDERAYYDQHGEARKKEHEINPNTELYKMLSELMMMCVMQMPNTATHDLVKQMKLKMREGVPELNEKINEAAKAALKITTVMKRIKSRTPDNVLAALLRTQLDGLEMQVARAKIMIETLEKGIVFMDDYEYEMVLMIGSAELNAALRQQESGIYDHFFTIRTI